MHLASGDNPAYYAPAIVHTFTGAAHGAVVMASEEMASITKREATSWSAMDEELLKTGLALEGGLFL